MPFRTGSWLLTFACVVFVVLAGTASAGSVGGTHVDTDAVDLNASVDTATPDPDATDDSTTSASVDGSIGTSSDGGTSVTANVSTNDTNANGTLTASVNDSGATIEGNASADDSGASASVDASTNDTTVEVGAEADPNGTTMSLTASAGTAPDDGAGSTAQPDETRNASEAAATTAASGAAPPGGGDGNPDSDPPVGPAAAGGVAVAGGAVLARRGLSAVGTGATPPPSTIHDALSAVVHWLRANVPRVLVPLRYSRRDDSDPLEHEVRADLYEAVETAPGVHLSRLDDQADVSLSSVRHHLRILEEEALIESDRIRGKRRYFPANASNTELRAALAEPATASVLRALAAVGSATVSDLADRLDRDPSTVSHHLSRLEEAGLVERERTGPAVVSRLAEGPRRVLGVEDTSDALASAD